MNGADAENSSNGTIFQIWSFASLTWNERASVRLVAIYKQVCSLTTRVVSVDFVSRTPSCVRFFEFYICFYCRIEEIFVLVYMLFRFSIESLSLPLIFSWVHCLVYA